MASLNYSCGRTWFSGAVVGFLVIAAVNHFIPGLHCGCCGVAVDFGSTISAVRAWVAETGTTLGWMLSAACSVVTLGLALSRKIRWYWVPVWMGLFVLYFGIDALFFCSDYSCCPEISAP